MWALKKIQVAFFQKVFQKVLHKGFEAHGEEQAQV